MNQPTKFQSIETGVVNAPVSLPRRQVLAGSVVPWLQRAWLGSGRMPRPRRALSPPNLCLLMWVGKILVV
jgi:hypothetical protein